MFRSGCCSFTRSAPLRRALARQLIVRTRSPGVHSRMSANSIAFALRARDLVADVRLRLVRREQRVQRLDARIDAQRLAPAEPLSQEWKPSRSVARTSSGPSANAPKRVAAQRQLERAALAGSEPDARGFGLAALSPRGQRHEDVDAVGADRRRELDRREHLLALERTLAVERSVAWRPRITGERRAATAASANGAASAISSTRPSTSPASSPTAARPA